MAAEADAVIGIGLFEDSFRGLADLVLPGTSYLERDGTTVNLEGRLQRQRRAVLAPCPDELAWISTLAARFGVTLSPHAALVFDEVSAACFGGIALRRRRRAHRAAAPTALPRRRRRGTAPPGGARRTASASSPTGRSSPARPSSAHPSCSSSARPRSSRSRGRRPRPRPPERRRRDRLVERDVGRAARAHRARPRRRHRPHRAGARRRPPRRSSHVKAAEATP